MQAIHSKTNSLMAKVPLYAKPVSIATVEKKGFCDCVISCKYNIKVAFSRTKWNIFSLFYDIL